MIIARSRRLSALAIALVCAVAVVAGQRRDDLPELTQPVNDFARVIDRSNVDKIDRMIRTLQAASGDVVVVATVPSIESYGDIREYANKLFENHGRGIGQKGKDNGLLILLALRERKVWVEVGYDLEQWVTDGFAGETSREYMVPEFRNGRYGDGLRIGTERIIGRIAQGRNTTLEGVRIPRRTTQSKPECVSDWPRHLHHHSGADARPYRRRTQGRRQKMGPAGMEWLVEWSRTFWRRLERRRRRGFRWRLRWWLRRLRRRPQRRWRRRSWLVMRLPGFNLYNER